ncbi:TPA: DUF3265 domain-containing protein [Vibrio vulnificus]|nr:DUF3265 domain-containing protein [Vibrio vulnificus]RZQ37864.1 DUF3265 domain-containing protein [Vibrio vulnificus]HAS8124510.1 DUF3265 domain-containing protein [Vibrio vulnificus]HAS8151820.1 DUF3265 domain-containing protein [Vibrio vulnificus]HAS8313198.1 DUF3265 domain-containing protein [Vibrio vulnificus]
MAINHHVVRHITNCSRGIRNAVCCGFGIALLTP